jgi:hypothetical protein
MASRMGTVNERPRIWLLLLLSRTALVAVPWYVMHTCA